MKVLFDQGTPVPLKESLKHHEVSTAHELGWPTTSWPRIKLMLNAVVKAIDESTQNSFIEIDIPYKRN